MNVPLKQQTLDTSSCWQCSHHSALFIWLQDSSTMSSWIQKVLFFFWLSNFTIIQIPPCNKLVAVNCCREKKNALHFYCLCLGSACCLSKYPLNPPDQWMAAVYWLHELWLQSTSPSLDTAFISQLKQHCLWLLDMFVLNSYLFSNVKHL